MKATKASEMTKTKMFPTRNDLDPAIREHMVLLLNQQLADTFDLYSQTKQAHWNVKGPEFYQLHELFDDLAELIEEHVDTIAERVTALGGVATGTVRMAAAASRLPDYPLDGIASLQSVEELAARYAQLAASTRQGINIATENGDADTADLLTEVSRTLDKALWFLEAHFQSNS